MSVIATCVSHTLPTLRYPVFIENSTRNETFNNPYNMTGLCCLLLHHRHTLHCSAHLIFAIVCITLKDCLASRLWQVCCAMNDPDLVFSVSAHSLHAGPTGCEESEYKDLCFDPETGRK